MSSHARRTASRARRAPFRGVLERLMRDITAGRLPVGSRLPTEHALAESFRTSRHSVREALKRLQQMGLIGRRQGSGTVVLAARPEPPFESSISTIEDLLQYAADTRLEVLTVETLLLDPATAIRLRCAAAAPWIRISALRRQPADPLPVAYTEIFLPARFAAIAAEIGRPTAVYAMLEERFGVRIACVEQEIEAAAADANLASRLAVALGTPVLTVTRRYLDDRGDLLEAAVNSHPVGRYRYTMRLERAPLAA